MDSSKGKTAFDWSLYQDRGKVLLSYRDSREYMDGILIASDGTSFPVHLVVVSGLGEFFTEFMYRQVNDTSNAPVELATSSGTNVMVKRITFPDISAPVLKTLIDIAYTAELTTDPSSVWRVLEVSERYKLKAVECGCCTFVSKLVSAENCLEMYRLAKQKHHLKLLNAALTSMKHNFRSVVEKSIFFSLIDVKDMNSMLAADDLNAEHEEYVWTAIKHWVMMDFDHRLPFLGKLVGNLRFQRVNPQFLTLLGQDPLITDPRHRGAMTNTVRRMSNGRNRGGYNMDGWNLPVGVFPDLVRPRIPNTVILAIGGWLGGQTTSMIESYDRSTNLWYEMSVEKRGPVRAYHGVQHVRGKLYIIGGTDGRTVQDTLFSFDPLTYEWEPLASMQYKRCYVSTAVLDGMVYAMGGHNGEFRMRYAERYDPNTNEWTPIADMIVARSDANACVVDGKIYVIGGLNENMIERTAEVYDPEKNEWSLLPELSTARSSLGVVSLRGSIYAIGGNSGERRLKTVERYDPGAESWVPVTSMQQKRSTFTATVMEDRIYVCGGYNGASPFDAVERFDPFTGTWMEIRSMNNNRSGLAVIAVSDLPNSRDYTFLGNTRAPNLRI
jgi:kelch-like protein 10